VVVVVTTVVTVGTVGNFALSLSPLSIFSLSDAATISSFLRSSS
jgi:hypothetical protein